MSSRGFPWDLGKMLLTLSTEDRKLLSGLTDRTAIRVQYFPRTQNGGSKHWPMQFELSMLSYSPTSPTVGDCDVISSIDVDIPLGCWIGSMGAFVLIHGTGHGGWCWRFVVPLLRAAGHEVYTPTLTGLGASSHLLHEVNRISLATHVQDVSNTLFYEDLSGVVLVGHSYAGMVITGVVAKEPQRLAHLVYLDAYLPLEGESEIVLWPPDQLAKYRTDLASGTRFRKPLSSSVLGITDPKMSQWVQERLTPHPYSTYEDPPASSTPESASVPRTYVHCTLGPFASWMEPFAVRARKLGWNVQTMAAGHDVMITHPNELADVLLRIAAK